MNVISKLKEAIKEIAPYADLTSPEATSLIKASEEVAKSWSGSVLGYHSRVYYRNLSSPPPGAIFSTEWGLDDALGMGTNGDWVEYDQDSVINEINRRAGKPNLAQTIESSKKAEEAFTKAKHKIESIIHSSIDVDRDKYLNSLINKFESTKIYSEAEFIKLSMPKGQFFSRDSLAVGQGIKTPPHLAVYASAFAFLSTFQSCKNLKGITEQLIEHLDNIGTKNNMSKAIGTHIFIGHGRSPAWRELKDFIGDRLDLPWDEFNRVPVAGISTVARLAQMLDQACFAFLIMTAEDEQTDGNYHARMNVIHEVGLFQGKLGFDKAIVLLEEGCEEFSNIQGLGQIRFPKGKISAIFEDIRHVLEHNGVIDQ